MSTTPRVTDLLDRLTTAITTAAHRPIYLQIINHQGGKLEVRQIEFLSVEDFAQLARVGPRTVYDWVQRGISPPPYRPPGSRSILFDLTEAIAWIKQTQIYPNIIK